MTVSGTGGFHTGTGGKAGTGGVDIGVGGGGGILGTEPVFIVPIDGVLRDILIDPKDDHIYVTNATHNQVEDYSLRVLSLLPAIAVGSAPNGFDITMDGSRLYVANSGGINISVVDLATRQELKKIDVPTPKLSSETPYSLAIAANGKALFSTTFAGSGFGARMMALDLATEVVSQRMDFYIGGVTTEATVLKANADRKVVAAIVGDASTAPVFVYDPSRDTFSPELDLNGFISTVAVSRDGFLILVDGSYVLDVALGRRGTISGRSLGAVFSPDDHVAYRSTNAAVEIVDIGTLQVTGKVAIPGTLQKTNGGSSLGSMVVTSNG
jgi:YVTN family beta-propeller protein